MTYIAKPRLHHPTLTTNKVGYTRRDYEGPIVARSKVDQSALRQH